MHKSKWVNVLLWISRVFFGIVFIFSGFVKAIDPLGSTYKFQDYFLAFGMDWLFPLALPLAIVLSGLEFLIGMAVLLGIKMRYSAWGGLIFMLFFTPLTLYIAIYEPVSDCGCFGDALIISNWATFYKNIFISAAAIFIFYHRNSFRPLWGERKDWYLVGLIAFSITALSVYCLRNLPILDFRPWKINNNIEEMLQPVQEEIAEYSFVYKNKESGELREFTIDQLAEMDESWEFVDRKETIIQEYIGAPVEEFVVQDEYGYDVAEEIIGNPEYQFILVVYDVNRTNERSFTRKINEFAQQAESDNISFVVLSGSSIDDIELFRHKIQAAYPFYQADAIKLKTMIRSNPGLILMKDWVVLGKWHHRNIPDYQDVKEDYLKE
jgi:uncharacterized membrane protein YphA (DoxX/SURF4 family)